MAPDQTTTHDPTTRFPRPEQPEQQLEHPGLEGDLDPRPDYGEESYRGSGRLEGRKALITGGDSGIGRAVALAFAREGADVVITHLPEEEADASRTLAAVQDAGRTGVALPGDLTDRAFCREIVERAVAELGGLDIVVNNAAYQMSHDDIDELTDEEIEHTFDTNIIAMFRICKAALKHLKPGAAIINTASVQAYKPSPNLLAYAATKAAIVNYTQNLAQLLIEQGIRVNAVAPGPVWTPLIPATMPADKVKSFGEQAPIGRAAQPVELAPAYVFLASQEASYVAGETLAVTGGTPLA
jgi:NAD(P)-dependent dehydrogenase (short-subunit alcohol dehydrogenase family)